MSATVGSGGLLRLHSRDQLSQTASTRMAYVELDDSAWVHEAGSIQAVNDRVIASPYGRWIRIGGSSGSDPYGFRSFLTTPDEGATSIAFGGSVPAGAADLVAVFCDGARLIRGIAPLGPTSFAVNEDFDGVDLGLAADGVSVYEVIVPTVEIPTRGVMNRMDLDDGDVVELPEGVEVLEVYLNGRRIQAGDPPGDLEWQVVDDVLSLGSAWDNDDLIVVYQEPVGDGGGIDEEVDPLALLKTANLGDLSSIIEARQNLELGDLAVEDRASLREVPAGGEVGQVLTKTAGGYAWVDP